MFPRSLPSVAALVAALVPAACASSRPIAAPGPLGPDAFPAVPPAAPESSGATGPDPAPALRGGEEGAGADSGREIVVSAARELEEEARVGYGQPEWTAHRRFARTRVYVLPEGQMELEQWWRGTFDHGEGPEHQYQTEIGIGLPGRFQFDLYGTYEHADGTTQWIGVQPELRWAPADWGEIPLNPTVYVEYKANHDDVDVAEGKLLFGEELSPGVHWGMNLSVEQQLGAEREQELAVTEAISYTLADRAWSIGAEFEYDRVTAEGSRDDPEHQFYAGPSIQWRPTENMHVDLVPLRGWHDAHDWRVFLVLGWDFGGGERGPHEPVSSKSR